MNNRSFALILSLFGWLILIGLSGLFLPRITAGLGSPTLDTLGLLAMSSVLVSGVYVMFYCAYLTKNPDEDFAVFTWNLWQVLMGAVIFIVITTINYNLLSASVELKRSMDAEIILPQSTTLLKVVFYAITSGAFLGLWIAMGTIRGTAILASIIACASAAGIFLGFWEGLAVLSLWFGTTLILRRKAIKAFFEMTTPDVMCSGCRHAEHLCNCPGAERRKIQDAFFGSLKFSAVLFASIALLTLVSQTYLAKNVYDNFLVLEQEAE